MPQTKNRIILNIILSFSILALISAYFIQYILGHQPCNLCLIERIPYFIAIIVIIVNFIIKGYEKKFILSLILIFSFATILSFYHFGIEQGFFKESFVCDLNVKNTNLTPEGILKELKDANISCQNTTFKFLGISLATINTIISLIISTILIKILLDYEKNK